MSTAAATPGLRPAFDAARRQLVLVVLLFGLAAAAWLWTADRMRGMDEGPGTDLGSLSWFVGVWIVMMAAMMFPSVSPTVALYARMARGRTLLAVLFASGYLAVWSAVGLAAYGVWALGSSALGDALAWDRGGRSFAAGILIAAALYELTPLKNVCLGKCRSPLGFLLGSWRDGARGAFELGAKHGAWCTGCCWALMAALFALGVMNVAWMALVAGLIAAEKILPWRRTASFGVAAVLLTLGVLLAAAPNALPGLTIPGSSQMPAMHGDMSP